MSSCDLDDAALVDAGVSSTEESAVNKAVPDEAAVESNGAEMEIENPTELIAPDALTQSDDEADEESEALINKVLELKQESLEAEKQASVDAAEAEADLESEAMLDAVLSQTRSVGPTSIKSRVPDIDVSLTNPPRPRAVQAEKKQKRGKPSVTAEKISKKTTRSRKQDEPEASDEVAAEGDAPTRKRAARIAKIVKDLAESAEGDDGVLSLESLDQASPEKKRRRFLKKTGFKPTDLSVFDFAQDMKPELEAELGEDGGELFDKPSFTSPATMVPPRRRGKQPTGTVAPGNPTIMCNFCNYQTTKKYLLNRHMRSHSEERPHKCSLCGNAFKTLSALNNHVNTHTGTKPFKCPDCDMCFTTTGEVIRHRRYKHTLERPHKCEYCSYASVELSKLRRHVRAHTGERPFQCHMCDYASPDQYKLKRHIRVHTGEKPYKCDLCDSSFSQSNTLKQHRKIHTGDKPKFECPYCSITCGRKVDLRYHIDRQHTSDQPLPCKKCDQEFPDRYTLKQHMRTHGGEKCFKCTECDYAALSLSQLEAHTYKHTGEKPFVCSFKGCDQAFRMKHMLKRHVNFQHKTDYVPPPPKDKVYECPECKKLFANHGNLLRHLAVHDVSVIQLDASNAGENVEIVTVDTPQLPGQSATEGEVGGDDSEEQEGDVGQEEQGQKTSELAIKKEEFEKSQNDSEQKPDSAEKNKSPLFGNPRGRPKKGKRQLKEPAFLKEMFDPEDCFGFDG